MEIFGEVARTPFEAIHVSLRVLGGEPHVELRDYARAAPGKANSVPGRAALVLPLGLLPSLLRALMQAQELLVKRGLLAVPPPGEGTAVERGESLCLPRERRRGDSRRSSRVRLRLAVECRLPNAAKSVAGEIRDVGLGGAQLLLPIRLPLFREVEVSIRIERGLVRGRAEVVGRDLAAQRGPSGEHYRHSLRWVVMEAPLKAALSKLLLAGTKGAERPRGPEQGVGHRGGPGGSCPSEEGGVRWATAVRGRCA